MSFKDKYTTPDILDVAILMDKHTKEQDKIVISNDAMAIGEMLELLCNKMVK